MQQTKLAIHQFFFWGGGLGTDIVTHIVTNLVLLVLVVLIGATSSNRI